jgi:putative phosphoribosyl transferase
VAMLEAEADRVVCLTVPRRLYGVGMWYEDFTPVADEEVIALLADARRRYAGGEDARRAQDAQANTPSESAAAEPAPAEQELVFGLGGLALAASVIGPACPYGLVVFAHGSGSSRSSPRNRSVAKALAQEGFACLLFDLLSEHEAQRRELVFDVALLAARLEEVTRRASAEPRLRGLPIGYFGASTGAAAALAAAAALGAAIGAVVSRGGRPDLAAEDLARVVAPTLLLVGESDQQVLELNRAAAGRLRCEHELAVVPGAGHLFEEPGAMERVCALAGDWFQRHLR